MIRSFVSSFVVQFSKHPAGAIGGICQLAVVFVGMPAQIWTNYQNHSTAGLSGMMFILAGLASVAWLVHATREIKSSSLMVSQVPSIIGSSVIVGQMVYY